MERRLPEGRVGFEQIRAKQLLGQIPIDAWQRLSCGAGSEGLRVYDWALMRLNAPEPKRRARWLLSRRRIAAPSEVAYFACGGPSETTFEQLVAVAGKRWAVEECFETAKENCGLDEYECGRGRAGTGT